MINDSGRSWNVERSYLSVKRVRKELEGGSSPSHPRGWSSCKGPPYPQRPQAGRAVYMHKYLKTQDCSNLSGNRPWFSKGFPLLEMFFIQVVSCREIW